MTAHLNSTPSRGLLAPIADGVRRLGSVLAETSDLMRCKREAERLFAMSDADLAKRGLTRDRVINHAFARYLGM